jgi:thymidine kinase
MLKFIYGVMGSSKSAQALITRYNYIQNNFKVLLIKPDVDNRDDTNIRIVKSRIGLQAECITFKDSDNLQTFVFNYCQDNNVNLKEDKIIIIVDECQFCTKEHINQLKVISNSVDIFCYGLKTNFRSELFEGSKRLMEIADQFESIPHICECGKQAIINARLKDGLVTTAGDEILIGDIEYQAFCHNCWKYHQIYPIKRNV